MERLLPFVLLLLTAAREAGAFQCREDEFRCAPDAECYPLAFVCDGHADCPDRGDERACATAEATARTQTDAIDAPESMAAEHWAILTIVALLVLVAAAALGVSIVLRVSRKAEPFPDRDVERLVRKEQP